MENAPQGGKSDNLTKDSEGRATGEAGSGASLWGLSPARAAGTPAANAASGNSSMTDLPSVIAATDRIMWAASAADQSRAALLRRESATARPNCRPTAR